MDALLTAKAAALQQDLCSSLSSRSAHDSRRRPRSNRSYVRLVLGPSRAHSCLQATSQWRAGWRSHWWCGTVESRPRKLFGGRERARSVRLAAAQDPSQLLDFELEDGNSEVGSDIQAAPPPTKGRLDIVIDNDTIKRLDLGPAHTVLRPYVSRRGSSGDAPGAPPGPTELLQKTVGFVINYTREDPDDPRELSEMPDIRVWFVRLDAAYPWLPAALDWRGGELARYAAMLVPHQMSRRMGLVFNPEALELFSMRKYFEVYEWFRAQGLPGPENKVRDMMRLLGFTIDQAVYDIVEQAPPP